MLESVFIILTVLSTPGVVYLLRLASKLIVVRFICTHKDLSDDKVKYIVSMFKFKKQL